MNISAPVQFKPNDYPDLPPKLLLELNRAFREVYDAIRRIPEVQQVSGKRFATDGNGDATVDIKNPLPQKPTSAVVDQVRAEDGSPIVDAWSYSFEMAGELVRLRIVGLTADSTYQMTVSLK